MRPVSLRPFVLLVASLLVSLSPQLAAREIAYNNVPVAKEQYLIGILKLAIEKSGDPSLKLKPSAEPLTDTKVKSEVMNGAMDVYWGPAVSEHVKDLKPIYIPLVKGLLGYRLFIINSGDQSRFDGVTDLAGLKRFTAGQGSNWGDTFILREANIPLETAPKYESLFYMLEGGRFDYFPRGAHEPWSEIATHKELNLVVEENLVLAYPLAMIFYVNKSDHQLASILTRGLEAAIADGSFDDYFYAQDVIKNTLTYSNMKSRRVITIPNPLLPDEMPLDRKELWFDIASIP